MDFITNPKKRDVLKDLHTYVSEEIYDLVDKLAKDKEIESKTEYVSALVEANLRQRGLL